MKIAIAGAAVRGEHRGAPQLHDCHPTQTRVHQRDPAAGAGGRAAEAPGTAAACSHAVRLLNATIHLYTYIFVCVQNRFLFCKSSTPLREY